MITVLARAQSIARRKVASALGRRPRLVRAPLVVCFVLAAGLGLLLWRVHSTSFLYLLYIGLSLVLGMVCWTSLVWMLDAWRSPASITQTRAGSEQLEPRHSFSLIVPARHEEAVLEATLSRLLATDHPAFEVLVVVGADDHGTREVAERVAASRPERARIIVDDTWPKSKPKALNIALSHCKGAVTGVFDAEDDVHPALLRRVDECFQRSGADVVQAGVQLMNFRSNWFAVRNVLEYYFWFRSRLGFHARQGFIPLGGNTVFVRTDVLRGVGGWDADCLAEDCELGVRLSSLGARTVVVYDPELVTREETPPTLGAFTRQRTRWNQGYLQTLSRGYWRRLPIAQRALGLYTLAMPYLLALAWLLMPAALATAIAVKAPVPVTLISLLPVLPMLTVLGVEAAGLGEFCRTYGERASIRDYARLVLGLPVYQAILAFAAARAVAREAVGVRGWEKTAHFGLHLANASDDVDERMPRSIPTPLQASVASDPHRASGELTPGLVAGSPGSRPISEVALSAYQWPRSGQVAVGIETAVMATGVRELRVGEMGREADDQAPRSSNGVGSAPAHGGREPLWTRLEANSTNGSAILHPPTPWAVGLDGSGRGRLARVCAIVRRFLTSHTCLVVQAPLLAGLAVVLGTNMLHWPKVFFDEGTYVANAWAVQAHGVLSNYTYGYGHPPLGWLALTLWTWASGIFGQARYSIDGGRELMLVITIVSCSLLYTLARRLGIGRIFAVGAVILFALSPVALYFHRLVLIDNAAAAWALAAFVLVLTPRRRLWAFAASGACFAASVLSKETMLALLPALLVAAVYNSDARTRRYCLTLLLSFLTLIGLTYPVYAALKGELLPGRGHVSLIGETFIQLFTRKASGSVFDSTSQAHATVGFWLHLDPWLVGAAMLLSPVAFARRNSRAIAVAYLVQVGMILRPGYLPYMYIIGLIPFAALIVAGSLEVLWRRATKHHSPRHLPSALKRWPALASRTSTLFAPATRAASVAAVVAVGYAVIMVVAPRWADANQTAIRARVDGSERAARDWLVRNVSHSKRLLVDSDFWIYLVEHGYDAHPMKGGFYSRTIVFNWTLDYDPAVRRQFPNAWRDFDYIVSTDGTRAGADQTPDTAQALRNSRAVVSFGHDDQRIEVRKIIKAQGPGG